MQRARLNTPLKQALDADGRRQSWLAERLDVDPRQVWGWVHGLHIPGASTQRSIADLLGRPVASLWPVAPHAAEVSPLTDPTHDGVGDFDAAA